jgi:hypothetical protein
MGGVPVTAAAVVAHASWWSQHGAHALLLVVPTVVLGLVGLRADLAAHRRRASDRLPQGQVFLRLAAVCSVVAAVVHAKVCPEHFGEATLYGVFFMTAALAQLGWAAIVWWQPRRSLLLAGVAGNVLVVALWALTRSVGIPLGPERGEVESVGLLDIVATVAEVGVVLTALLALSNLAPRRVTTVEA